MKPATKKARPQPAITVVLVRPQEEGNVGAVARAMANMGLSRLTLVEPAVQLGDVARAFSVKAYPLLLQAARASSLAEAVGSCARVIATTALRGRSLPFEVWTPRRLGVELASTPDVPTALVFGPETSGLTSEELSRATAVVRIPSAEKLPTLNLAQAVMVLAYEAFQARLEAQQVAPAREAVEQAEPAARISQAEGLFTQVSAVLHEIGFARDETFAGVLRDLRQLAARSGLTEREIKILRGICRRASNAVRFGGSDRD